MTENEQKQSIDEVMDKVRSEVLKDKSSSTFDRIEADNILEGFSLHSIEAKHVIAWKKEANFWKELYGDLKFKQENQS